MPLAAHLAPPGIRSAPVLGDEELVTTAAALTAPGLLVGGTATA